MISLAMIASLIMPPERYTQPPKRHFEIVEVSAALIDDFCANGIESMKLACWRESMGKVYVRDDLTPAARAKVIRHEIGHINGWSHL